MGGQLRASYSSFSFANITHTHTRARDVFCDVVVQLEGAKIDELLHTTYENRSADT